MDKNTLIGILLMTAVFLGFMWFSAPSEEQIAAQKEQQRQEQVEAQRKAQAAQNQVRDSLTTDEQNLVKQNLSQFGGDSARLSTATVSLALDGGQVKGTVKIDGHDIDYNQLAAGSVADVATSNKAIAAVRDFNTTYSKNGPFSSKMKGTNQVVKLENDSLKLEISSKGGMITRATVKGHKSALNAPLVEVFSPGDNEYSFILNSDAQRYDTKDYYFTPRQLNDTTVEMDLDLEGNAQFGIRYTLARGGNYMVRMEIVQRGMTRYIGTNIPNMDFQWHQRMQRHEAGKMFEDRNSTIYYKYAGQDGEIDNLSESSDKSKDMQDRLKWISTKDQFFSAVLIADKQFVGANLHSTPFENEDPAYQTHTKDLSIESSFDYSSASPAPASFFFYLGPNRYRLLKDYDEMLAAYGKLPVADKNVEDLHLTRLVPLGWTLFRWINTGIIIPVFNWLGSMIANYGIIILILTLLIKLVLSPLTFKTYMSQAKMRVLSPDIKALNEKYPGQDNAMKRQQKTMELYRMAGASPMAGCLPMLLMMPVYIAVFAFFPSCIELRGESFLWAADLSAPDAIVSWGGQIPFITNYFGNHISLFCLLMTVTNIVYTYLTMQSQNTDSSMPAMKWMMYLMPLFFLVFFNNYASGLSLYYFLSLLITIAQTYLCRALIDENKVRAQMAENAKKPKKKSGFMARLEEAQKQQQAALAAQQKRNGKGRR